MKNDHHKRLMARIAKGEKDAFVELYRDLEKPLYGFVKIKLNDSSEASDIVHETFMEVWRSAGSFEGRSAVKSWILA